MFTTLNKDDVSLLLSDTSSSRATILISGCCQHARRKRILADRYANTNVVKPQSLDGIAKLAGNFVKRCFQSVGGSLDLYVRTSSFMGARTILTTTDM
jgi:hypothetical protein